MLIPPMVRYTYQAALSLLSDRVKQGQFPKLGVTVQEDLGVGLSVQYGKSCGTVGENIIDMDCNLNTSAFNFSPVRELMNTFNLMDGTGDLDTAVNKFLENAERGVYRTKTLVFSNVQVLSLDESEIFNSFLHRLRESNLTMVVIYKDSYSESSDREKFVNSMSGALDSVIGINPISPDSFEFLLGKLGYNLPVSFTSQLLRLSSGSIELFRYAMSYYRANGILLDNKELNDALFRYFPIPPSISSYYGSSFKALHGIAVPLLYLVSLTGRLPIGDVQNIFHNSVSELEGAIQDLENLGFVVRENAALRITMAKLQPIVSSFYSDTEKSEIGNHIRTSPYFDRLTATLRTQNHDFT